MDSPNYSIPHDGLISGALSKALRANIDYDEEKIEMRALGITISFFYENSLVSLPPLSRKILHLKADPIVQTGMVENLELPDGTNTVETIHEVNENNQISFPLPT